MSSGEGQRRTGDASGYAGPVLGPRDGAPGWDRTNLLLLVSQVPESQAEPLLWDSGLVRQLPLFPDRLADQAPGTAVLLKPSTSAASSELLFLVFDDLPIEIKRKKKVDTE